MGTPGMALLGTLFALLLVPPNIDAMIVSSMPRRLPHFGLQRLAGTSTSFATYQPHQRRRQSSAVVARNANAARSRTSPLSSSSEWTTIDWLGDTHNDEDGHCNSNELGKNQGERTYDVATFSDLLPTNSPQQPSPVERLLIRDRLVYIKRDDLLRLSKSNVSGNKARKFLSLNELAAEFFPDVVVSYGGPQSNAMLALAAIVNSKNVNDDVDSASSSNAQMAAAKKRFVYYTKKLPRYLRQQPSGNFLRAKSLGMELVELPPWRYDELFGGESGGSATPPAQLEPPASAVDGVKAQVDDNDSTLSCLFVPQGGASGVASRGARLQAQEIVEFWHRNGKGLPLAVCLPGGTCTTALLLHRELNNILNSRRQNHEHPLDIQVVVIPCVGGDEYAQRQMSSLDVAVGGDGKDLPAILKPTETNRYYRFGNPDLDIIETYKELKEEYGILFDLLYGAPAWTILLRHWSDKTAQNSHNSESPIAGRQIMYVHSGGLEGISSQLTRYKHKGLVDPKSIQ